MRTIQPTGHQGIWLCGVAYLIASSPTFQALVSAANAAAALVHVATIGDDSEASGSTRPRAIVYPCEGFRMTKIAMDRFRVHLACEVSFEFVPGSEIEAEPTPEDRWWDETTDWCNTADAIFRDVFTLQASGNGYVSGQTHVAVEEVELIEGPGPIEEVRAQGQQGETGDYVYAGVYRVYGAG